MERVVSAVILRTGNIVIHVLQNTLMFAVCPDHSVKQFQIGCRHIVPGTGIHIALRHQFEVFSFAERGKHSCHFKHRAQGLGSRRGPIWRAVKPQQRGIVSGKNMGQFHGIGAVHIPHAVSGTQRQPHLGVHLIHSLSQPFGIIAHGIALYLQPGIPVAAGFAGEHLFHQVFPLHFLAAKLTHALHVDIAGAAETAVLGQSNIVIQQNGIHIAIGQCPDIGADRFNKILIRRTEGTFQRLSLTGHH